MNRLSGNKKLNFLVLLLLLFGLYSSLRAFYQTRFFSQARQHFADLVEDLGSPFGKLPAPSKEESVSEATVETPETVTATGAGPADDLTVANPILPSISGFGTNKFAGSSTVSYPIALSPGPAGFTPSLSLTYSSGSVDDLHNRNRCWDKFYHTQASWVGLGWNLEGLGYIARDPGKDLGISIPDNDLEDDRFFLVFPGGSAELVNETSYTKRQGDEWKTSPNLFLKIHHTHYGKDSPDGRHLGANYDTDPWIITAKDGTTYYFGNPTQNGRLCADENCERIFASSQKAFGTDIPGTGDVILDRDKDGQIIPDASLATEYTMAAAYWSGGSRRNRIIPQRWLLRKIVNPHGQTIEIKYDARIRDANMPSAGVPECPQSGSDPWCPDFHPHDIRPRQIIYGKDGQLSVKFLYEGRDDYMITLSKWDKDEKQCKKDKNYSEDRWLNSFSHHRLKSIEVKVDGQLSRRYDLSYAYSHPAGLREYDKDFGGHSLLTSITQVGTDGKKSLPPYRFEYTGSGYQVYLKTANNGYNGKVVFDYEETVPRVCQDYDDYQYKCRDPNDSHDQDRLKKFGCFRQRVTSKKVYSGLGDDHFKIEYLYNGYPTAWVMDLGKKGKDLDDDKEDHPLYGFRFLGHEWVEEKLYGYNDGPLVSQSKTYYYSKKENPGSCFKPDPRAGQTYQVENKDTNGQILSTSQTILDPNLDCDQIKIQEAYFIAPKESQQTIGNKTAKVEYTLYDEYGNLMEMVHHGDISKSGDEKTLFSDYFPNEQKWILGFPAYTNTYQGDTRGNPGGENLVTQVINYYDGVRDFGKPPEKGNLTMVQQGKSGESKTVDGCTLFGLLSTQFEYDDYGNQTKVIDSLGNETKIDYDDTYKTYPTDTDNPLGHHIHTDYDFVLGVPTAITDPNGKVTNVEYDVFGRRLKVLQPSLADLGNKRPEVQFQYFDQGEKGVPASVLTKVKKAEQLLGDQFLTSIVHYNGLGQQIQSQSEWEGGNLVLSNTSYNSQGQVDKASLPYDVSGGVGNYQTPNWGMPHSQSFYDPLGRVTRVINPDGTDARNVYSDWTVTSFDEENHQTLVENDAYGQAIKAQTFDDAANVYTTTNSQYDILGNILAVETEGHQATATYDSHSWKLTSDDPDLGAYRYCYDKNGNLLWQKDPKDQVVDFDYDALNRVTKKTLPDGSYVSYSYDFKDDPNGIGRLDKREDFDSSGTMTGFAKYDYDALGRVGRVHKEILGEFFSTTFSYNLLGNISKIYYPDGEEVENTYDSLGRLDQVRGSDLYVSEITYTPQGEIRTITLGDGTTTTYGYYPENRRLESISSPVLNYSYTYDQVGNIKTWSGFSSGENLTFNYDHLYRLKSAAGLYHTAYDYDKLGRMLTKNEEDNLSLEYDLPNVPLHAPGRVADVDYQYDPAGNLISDDQRIISWSPENKPVKIEMKTEKTPKTTSEPDSGGTHFGDLLGASVNFIKELLKRMFSTEDDGYDLNKDGVVNSLDFGTALVEEEPSEKEAFVTDYVYDGDGVRVLRQVTVRDKSGKENIQEKKIYVNQYFAKDLISEEIEKYYFAGGKRIAVRKITP